MTAPELAVSEMVKVLAPHLDERQRRLLAGAGARVLGRGGLAALVRVTGMSPNTVRKGRAELDQAVSSPGRVRGPGGGRKRATDKDPGLLQALDALVDPETRGDPESPLRWTTKSTRTLARALTAQGHPVSHVRVGELLHALGYSLQANAKVTEGKQHPDRDAQFRHINATVRRFLGAGDPVISVDTKKKELVGSDPGYKNGGREWQPTGHPVRVGVHDFPDPTVPKAVPYGIYDVAANAGWVSVGTDHDTAAFAVATIRRWWQSAADSYPNASRLLITADGGGSNGYRTRLWRTELADLAGETGLRITVCHLPPGTSKWNKIEHRLFSHISMNWRGRPLISHDVIVQSIAATTTRTGLTVHAELDTDTYPVGVKIPDAQMNDLHDSGILHRHDWHPEWNYTLNPPGT